MDLTDHLLNPAFRTLFAQTRDAVMIAEARNCRILEANPRALELLEYTLEQLRECSLTDLSPNQHLAIMQSFIRNAGEHSSSLTTRLLSRSGIPLPCELSLQPLTDASGLLLITFEDLSERIRAMEDIELRNVAIANVSSGVTIADARQPDLPLIYVNQGFQKITGYSAREAVGRSCRFLQGEDRDQPALDDLRKALRLGEDCIVQLRNYRKDGTLFHNELHISPVHNEAGELTHFVGIQLDVTEQVKARESLERSEQRYRQALEREQELNEIKTRFISMVSHEFRTPMTGIQASASLIRKFGDRLDEEKKQRHLENIASSLKRMNRLLDDVLFFSRAEAGKLKINRKPINLDPYFHQLIEGFSMVFPDRKILLFSEVPPARAYLLDEHLLDHIFQNLISNALKYSENGTPIHCAYRETEQDLVFSVRDFGIGIPQPDQLKLFEAFHRAGNVGARQGTGLGLNIALRAIELLDGSITFSSKENEGSTFLVRLPIKKANQDPHEENSHS